MKKKCATLALMGLFGTMTAQAQEAPAPRAMPRVPVSHESLSDQRETSPPSHQVQGPAAILDGEKLRIGEVDLRLFGIVPPQLAASFGPQARSALDSLANGQSVSCQIRDRDRDGRLLATCSNSAGVDMALELLKRGLAVSARGTLAGTELATAYLNAEQVAQNQKIGLWSTAVPAPIVATPASMTPSAAVKQEVATLAAALPSFADPKREEKTTAAVKGDKAPTFDPQPKPALYIDPAVKTPTTEVQSKIAADVVEQHAQAQQAQLDQAAWAPNPNVGFFERYQILIAGLLMLATALSIIAALWEQKRRDKRDETKAVAAALRGELMAARSVCVGRMKIISNDADDAAMTWPRIRVTLYQAYVGRLGLLGAELARQIASVYGQSSDYASLYSGTGPTADAPKRQALETLIRNVDEILPKLASIEQTGVLPAQSAYTPPRQNYSSLAPTYARPTASAPFALKSDNQKLLQKKPDITPDVKVAEVETTELAHPIPVNEAHPVAHPVTPPTALWEAVRGFIQSHRNAITQQNPSLQGDGSLDPHVAEYAAMIEADMARYRYSENIEPLDISLKKKQG